MKIFVYGMLLHLSQHTSRIDVLLSAGRLKSSELSNVFDAKIFTLSFEECFHQEKIASKICKLFPG